MFAPPHHHISPFCLTLPATPEIYTLSLHDALPISLGGTKRLSISTRTGNGWKRRLNVSKCWKARTVVGASTRSEEHTSELQSLTNLVCRLLLEKKKKTNENRPSHAAKHVEAMRKRA